MPRTRELVAQDVAKKLNEVEAQIDEAIAAASELLASMPAARLQAKVAASVGHDAITAAADGLASLISARTKFVFAHDDLANVREQLGLRVMAGGDLWKLVSPPKAHSLSVANDREAA